LAAPDLTLTDTASPNGSSAVNLGPTANITNVLVGSILVLRDTTQASSVFTRNGAWRIIGFDDSTPGAHKLTIAANDAGNYPAAGTVASGQWTIVLGATVYPDQIYDPTNYPSGGDMYGKQSEDGTFSDTSTANVLQAG
jgi:hypothetical protein